MGEKSAMQLTSSGFPTGVVIGTTQIVNGTTHFSNGTTPNVAVRTDTNLFNFSVQCRKER
jgi:hypothetical protein